MLKTLYRNLCLPYSFCADTINKGKYKFNHVFLYYSSLLDIIAESFLTFESVK